ncbi:MAG: orotidine 5'-phosphate decarboxylase / HUMPS family protein [Acidilobaceae archaeon]
MSRIIVALDSERGDKLSLWLNLVDSLCGRVAGFKFGLPFLLQYGLDGLRASRLLCDNMFIADLKLADIAPIMVNTVSLISDYIDAIIAHGFTGFRGGLDRLKEYLDSISVKLIVVASMSHPGSMDVIDPSLDRIMDVILKVNPWGLVAPATRPEIISMLRSRGLKYKILSPGIGVQGAKPGDGLRSGADYEIIGRFITRAPNPIEVVDSINLEHSMILEGKTSELL